MLKFRLQFSFKCSLLNSRLEWMGLFLVVFFISKFQKIFTGSVANTRGNDQPYIISKTVLGLVGI